MRTAQEWMDLYGVSHKNMTNIVIHKICVPLIMFSTLTLLYSIPLHYSFINVALVAIVLSLFFYARMSWKVFALMFVQSTLMYALILFLRDKVVLWQLGVGVFTLSWIAQFIGHKIEGKKPSFIEDLQFLLIGPAWIVRGIIGLK